MRSFLFSVITTTIVLLLSGRCVFGQDLNKRLSLDIHNEQITAVIERISAQTGIRFSYSQSLEPMQKKINLQVHDKTLKEIFELVFRQHGIDYLVVEGQVVLKFKPIERPQAVKYSISGFLRDKASGEILIGAAVYAEGYNTGVSTNAYGFYSLTLPEGDYNFRFSYLGYIAVKQGIALHKDLHLSVDLEEYKVEMKEVEITGSKQSSSGLGSTLSEVHFTPRGAHHSTWFCRRY
jgi:hypothetical protein